MTATGNLKCSSLALGLLAAAIWVASVLPFSRSVNYGVVNCDDYDYVARSAALSNGLSVVSIKAAFSLEEAGKQGIWMPLTWISYMIDVEVAGWLGLPDVNATETGRSAANVMHAHSVLLHGVAAMMLFILLVMLSGAGLVDGGRVVGPVGISQPTTGNRQPITRYGFRLLMVAAIAALFWSVHPLRCESAVWIASRKDILSGVFLLLAFVLWLKGALERTLKRSLLFRGVAIVAFSLAAMAKPSVMTFPVLAALLDVFIVGRIRPGDYIVPVLMAVGIGLFAGNMQAAGGATNDLADVPMWARLMNAAAAFGIYLKNTVWPADLAIQCMHRYPELPRFVWPGLALSAAAAFWLGGGLLRIWDERGRCFRRVVGAVFPEYDTAEMRRPVFAGCLWFVVAVAPMLGLANFGYHAFADRFTYIPAMGLSIVLFVWMSRMAWVKWPVLAGVCATGMLAIRQTAFWQNDRTIWEHTLEVDGDGNAAAHASLALYEFEFPHDVDSCIRHFRRVLELKPMFVEGVFHLYQFALCEKGMMEEASDLLGQTQKWSMCEQDRVESVANAMGLKMERRNLPPYVLSRIANFIHTPGMEKAGEEELDALAKRFPDNPYVFYLKMRAALKRGDEKAVQKFKEQLRSRELTSDYVRFRYFRLAGKDSQRKEVAE